MCFSLCSVPTKRRKGRLLWSDLLRLPQSVRDELAPPRSAGMWYSYCFLLPWHVHNDLAGHMTPALVKSSATLMHPHRSWLGILPMCETGALLPQHVHTDLGWASDPFPSHTLRYLNTSTPILAEHLTRPLVTSSPTGLRARAALHPYQFFSPRGSSERWRGDSSSNVTLNWCSGKAVKWVNKGIALNAQAEFNVNGHSQVSALLSYFPLSQMWALYPVNFNFQVEGTFVLKIFFH